MATILVLHGPNLNLLGVREPHIYGATTLEDVNNRLRTLALTSGHQLVCFQSNAEHELIEQIHTASQQGIDFLIFNPAAFTHTSIALRDAILGVNMPFIEVHLSNVFGRESFRHHSYFSDIAQGVICGLGAHGYEYAVQAAIHHLESLSLN